MFEDLHELPVAQDERHDCPNCGATGKWVGGTNNHGNDNCLRCHGRGFLLTDPKTLDKRRASKKRNPDDKRSTFISKHRELLDWAESATSWNNFASSVLQHLARKGELTDNQLDALQRMKDKTEATLEANVITVDMTKLHDLFDTAKASGLKRPALTIGDVRVSLAPATGNNAGHLYVKQSDQYQGKVSPEGKFLTVCDADESIKPKLIAIAKDPKGQLRSIGRDTGVCCCCGRELTDPKSIEAGIGPVCATKWDL